MPRAKDDHHPASRSIHCRQAIAQQSAERGFRPTPFTDVIRDGARKLIQQAIHAELATLMAAFSWGKLD